MKGTRIMKWSLLLAGAILTVVSGQVAADDYANVIKNTPGLVAYLRFEEPSGRTLHSSVGDFGGHVSKMIPSGTSEQMSEMSGTALRTSEGLVGRGIRLNGEGGAKIFRHPALESGWHDFSVEMWFKPDEAGGDLFSRQSSYFYRCGFVAVRLTKGGKVNFTQRGKTGSVRGGAALPDDKPNWWSAMIDTKAETPEAVEFGRWHHVVLTRKKGILELYLNGEKKAEAKCPEAAEIPPYGDWMIGIGPAPEYHENSRFKGTIDEFAYYNRALRASEIKKHYSAVAATQKGTSG